MNALQEPYTFTAHESHIIDLTFTPDGGQLLTAGMDKLVHCYSKQDWSLFWISIDH
jgi:WD40 repeat protein